MCDVRSIINVSLLYWYKIYLDDRTKTKVIAGQPSFIVQEEFDRYTGYWWQPQTKGTI